MHGDEHDERFAALECVRSGRMWRYGNARVTTGIGDTERAARLEQQLWNGPEQGGVFPLQQFAKTLL